MKNYDPVKGIYTVIIILVSLYTLDITSAFFCILILSALFAYVIHPVYFFCLRFVKIKQICALIPLGAIFLLTVSSGVMIVKALMNEISKLLEIPNTINGFANMDLRRIVGIFEPFIQTHPGKLTASPVEGPVERMIEKSVEPPIEKSVERPAGASGDHIFSPEINPWHDREKAI